MKRYSLPLLVLLVIVFMTGFKEFTSDDLDYLRTKATQLDNTLNVNRRIYVDTYFQLGDACSYFNKTTEAMEAYKKGLRLDASRFDYQFKLAKLELEKNNLVKAKKRFLFITHNSPDAELQEKAEKYLNSPELKQVIMEETLLPEMYDYTLFIARFGEVSDLYTRAVSSRIYQEYKINVEILNDPLIPDEEKIKNNRKIYFDRIIDDLKDSLPAEVFEYLLLNLGISPEEDLTYAEKEKIVHWVYLQEDDGDELWERNMKLLGNQYNAKVLINQVKSEYAELLDRPNVVGVLGIIAQDIYIENTNFLFGYAGPEVGVISYNRFIYDDTPVSTAIKRIIMQAFSSAGFIIGIPRCTTPVCARAYPHNLEEHDKKDDVLCEECNSNLKKRYNELRHNNGSKD